MSGKVTALILAAGSGSRMGDGVKKQYRLLLGEPLITHTLRAFLNMQAVDDIMLTVPEGEEDGCRKLAAELETETGRAGSIQITTGGARRCDSVLKGLQAIHTGMSEDAVNEAAEEEAADCIVLIHDGARPFADENMVNGIIRDVKAYGSGVAAVPVKDTIRVRDENGFGVSTPDRSTLMSMQTPQAFYLGEILEAYEAVLHPADDGEETGGSGITLTDDAQVYTLHTGRPVRLSEGSYENIKITTPEDMLLAQEIARLRGVGR